MRRRVVITGIGTINAAGLDMKNTWQNVCKGEVKAGQIKRFDANGFLTTIAYEVDASFKKKFANLIHGGNLTRQFEFGLIAAQEAWDAARIRENTLDEKLFSVVMGVGMGTDDFAWFLDFMRDSEIAKGKKNLAEPATFSAKLAEKYGAKNCISSIHTACASSAQALGEAYDMIAVGEANVVMAGGTDAMIEPLQLAGFGLLGALSKQNDAPEQAQRPFDRDRTGFVLGEGACILILEDLDSALARNANIVAEICGYGVSASAFRITDLDPTGTGPREAMNNALVDSGIDETKIDYINTHGTGTFQNDLVESNIIKEIFSNAKVSSTKTLTGHLIASAGAMECALTAYALNQQIFPPSVNVSNQDPECPVNLTSNVAIGSKMHYAMSNSIAFGGSNVSLVLKRWE